MYKKSQWLWRTLVFLAVSLSLPLHAAEVEMPDSYRALSRPAGWLNTQRALTAEDLRGRVILLDFWTYCCINCMHVIPDLHYLEQKFGDRLTVIGVHSAKFANEKDTGNIRAAIVRYGIAHPVVNDADFSVWKYFGVNAWPTFVLLTPMGGIAGSWAGEGHRGEIERAVATTLERYGSKVVTAKLPLALEKDKQPETVLKFPGKIIYVADFYGKPALMVSDSGHHRIVVLAKDGQIIASIGSGQPGLKDGDFAQAQFRSPQGLVYKNHVLYVADTENHTLRKVDFAAQRVTTVAGTGQQGQLYRFSDAPALRTALSSPWDVAFYPDDNHVAIAMAGVHQLWSYDIAHGTLNVLAGSGRENIDDGAALHASLAQTSGLSTRGDTLYFVDAETSSLRAYKNGRVDTLIGTGLFDFGLKDGAQGSARLQHPLGLYADAAGIYVADAYNHALRFYDFSTAKLSTVATDLHEPNAVAAAGDALYIADTNDHAIRIYNRAAKTLRALEVHEEAAVAMPSEDLPNSERLPNQELRASHVELVLQLEKGWHINTEAPSSAALFDVTDKTPKVMAEYDKTSLLNARFSLPVLKEGRRYRLQGTFYYCANQEGAQCLIKSVDAPFTATNNGAALLQVNLPPGQP